MKDGGPECLTAVGSAGTLLPPGVFQEMPCAPLGLLGCDILSAMPMEAEQDDLLLFGSQICSWSHWR